MSWSSSIIYAYINSRLALVRDVVYTSFFEKPIGQILIEDENLKLIFSAEQEVILQLILQ